MWNLSQDAAKKNLVALGLPRPVLVDEAYDSSSKIREHLHLKTIVLQQDASLRRGLLSDVHAPPKWRVNGPLANIGEFHEAFGVKPGQAMYRADADRVRIW